MLTAIPIDFDLVSLEPHRPVLPRCRWPRLGGHGTRSPELLDLTLLMTMES